MARKTNCQQLIAIDIDLIIGVESGERKVCLGRPSNEWGRITRPPVKWARTPPLRIYLVKRRGREGKRAVFCTRPGAWRLPKALRARFTCSGKKPVSLGRHFPGAFFGPLPFDPLISHSNPISLMNYHIHIGDSAPITTRQGDRGLHRNRDPGGD